MEVRGRKESSLSLEMMTNRTQEERLNNPMDITGRDTHPVMTHSLINDCEGEPFFFLPAVCLMPAVTNTFFQFDEFCPVHVHFYKAARKIIFLRVHLDFCVVNLLQCCSVIWPPPAFQPGRLSGEGPLGGPLMFNVSSCPPIS